MVPFRVQPAQSNTGNYKGLAYYNTGNKYIEENFRSQRMR